ncbi:uncharacterized protein LOC120634835 [Pararge aegeria]|uniref:uncharacterized protein LOC120634835 n=1 Tax=Pararge aegeria TaxID=116150 RepID=UPI0019CF86CE|nr:uncharacterized protein LOC120634835 [Pararge aegeria]
MMAEQHSRKTHVPREHKQRPKNNFVKTSGDEVPGKRPASLKSRNVLPKNLRYGLENALVGLCDVWFEEIKPYLERNSIKVHVHETVADIGEGDGNGAPDCSHFHPASSASRCELCRLLFNAANSIESAVSQAASVSSVCTTETHNKE